MRALLLLACAAALRAGEVFPLIEFECPSVTTLIERLAATPWGKAWNDAGMADAREELERCAKRSSELYALDPLRVIPALHQVRAVQFEGSGQSVTQFSAKSGAQAEPLWKALLAATPERTPITVAGALSAFAAISSTANRIAIARNGDAMSVAMGASAAALLTMPTAIMADGPDASLRVALRRFSEPDPSARHPAAVAVRERLRALRRSAPELLADLVIESRVVEQGFHDQWRLAAPLRGLAPVDRTALLKLPPTTLAGGAIGLNGQQLWAVYGDVVQRLLAAFIGKEAEAMELNAEQREAMASRVLAEYYGVTMPIRELISGLDGTVVVALLPSVPDPSLVIMLPRTPAFSALLAGALRLIGKKLPDNDAPVNVAIPGFPTVIRIVARGEHWLIIDDERMADQVLAAGAAVATPAVAAKNAIEAAPTNAQGIGFVQTGELIRSITQHVWTHYRLENQGKQRIRALNRLSMLLPSGQAWLHASADATVFDMRAPVGAAAVPLVATLGLLVYPELLEDAARLQEQQAAKTLKSVIFPGMILFQSSAIIDSDGDGRGESGVLGELAGDLTARVTQAQKFIPASFRGTDPVVDGYCYRIFVPTALTSATLDARTAADASKRVGVCTLQEDQWIAYAWPAPGSAAARLYAITPAGVVYEKSALSSPAHAASATSAAKAPAWNDLYSGGEWSTRVLDGSGWTRLRE